MKQHKALSVRQPFATLIVLGLKNGEVRSRPTKFRGRLLIHASKTPLDVPIMDFFAGQPEVRKNLPAGMTNRDLPLGKIIGMVDLVDCIQAKSKEPPRGIRTCCAVSSGDYIWVLRNPERFDPPIPWKGALGLWNYDGELPQESLNG